MKQILDEFNKTNSTNDKLKVMEKYKDNDLVIEVFQKCLDKVKWTYGVSMKNIKTPPHYKDFIELDEAIELLEKLADRTYTGNAAIEFLEDILYNLSEDNAYVVERIIDRDLKINFGKTGFNKVVQKEHKITKPPYMRCGIYTAGTAKKIKYPALIQIKADGAYQSITVEKNSVTFTSRSGEEREFEHLKDFKKLPDGVYIGELLVHGLNNRSEANGIINSDDSKDDVYIQLWDYITLEEYSRGKDKKNKEIYEKRLAHLTHFIPQLENPNIKVIETHDVDTIQEALKYTSDWMHQGYEGAILKDFDNIFVDHTSPTQLKLKLEIDAEVRVTGFTEGKKGTKREKTFGAITFENDEGTIKGQTSGFSDKMLEEINKNREQYINKVITVQFNDLTKSRDNDWYALSHPRFIEFRTDKNETDTLERVQELKKMAMLLED